MYPASTCAGVACSTSGSSNGPSEIVFLGAAGETAILGTVPRNAILDSPFWRDPKKTLVLRGLRERLAGSCAVYGAAVKLRGAARYFRALAEDRANASREKELLGPSFALQIERL